MLPVLLGGGRLESRAGALEVLDGVLERAHGQVGLAQRALGETFAEPVSGLPPRSQRLLELVDGLGQAQSLLGRFADAHRSLTQALVLRQRAGDKTGEAKVLNSLAVDLFYQGRHAAALGYLEEAKAIHIGQDDKVGTAVVLNNLSLIHI